MTVKVGALGHAKKKSPQRQGALPAGVIEGLCRARLGARGGESGRFFRRRLPGGNFLRAGSERGSRTERSDEEQDKRKVAGGASHRKRPQGMRCSPVYGIGWAPWLFSGACAG